MSAHEPYGNTPSAERRRNHGVAGRLLILGAVILGGCASPGGNGATSDTSDTSDTQQSQPDSSSLFDPNAPLPAASDVATLAARYAAVTCARLARCSPRGMSWRYQDDTECLSISTADALRYFQFNAAAVAAGRMQYNAAENRSCEIAVLESACEVDLEQDAACVAAFVGTVGEYQGCDSASYECAPGLDCILDDSATSRCGLCKNALAEGQVCSLSEVCAPGFTCEFGDDTNVCVRLATREGESCVPSDFADTCAGTLQCVDGAGSPRCALPSQEGASCDSGSDVDVCDGNKWLICAEDKCQQRAVVGRGERCDNELRVCEYGDTCTEVDPGVFVCRPRVQPGGSCAKSQCARDAFCNDDDVCEAKRAAGASCTRSSQCVGGLSCLNAGGLPSGTRTCRPVEWMECE